MGLQTLQAFEQLNDMPVTQISDLRQENIDVYGIPWDKTYTIEPTTENIARIAGGTITNAKGVEISMNRIYGWSHWNYAPDARLIWDFMKKYARTLDTGETILLNEKPDYSVEDGISTSTESDNDPSFATTGTADKLTTVRIDDQIIDPENYTLKDGRLTLKAAYLQSLQPGNHKLSLAFTDGNAETTFTITEPEKEKSNTVTANTDKKDNGSHSPKTGVTSYGGIYGSLAASSIAIATATWLMLRRKKH